jgi:outer membrane protein OmpA-like peptidoglycan-associated protein
MRIAPRWTLLFLLAFNMQSRAEDCVLGQRYLSLAHERVAAFKNDEAIVFLRQGVDACPSYDAFEELGELAALSTERADKEKAVGAFVGAYTRASSSQERSRTLYHYARLLNQDGDPENAYPLIKQACALEPANAEYAALSNTVENQVQHPTEEHIVRALHYSLFQPLRTPDSSTTGAATGQGLSKHQTPTGGGGPSVNIPINFDTATVIVDQETRPNIVVLAHALADPSMEGHEFTFIGHSDIRGGDQYNLNLSLHRADAISQSVIAIEPGLKGRIHVEGHGAREPIDSGSDARALQANRRLQVVIQ